MGRAFEYRKASKLARWDKMAKQFSRISREISIAVKSGGSDPHTNPLLRRCIVNAKGANMPKENVEKAIKKASGADAVIYDEVCYEGYAPYGIAVFLECTTNNPVRTVANVRAIFNKFQGSLGKNGELSFLFERKGVFSINKQAIKMEWEDFELEAIDAGAEEIEVEDNEVIITTNFQDFGSFTQKLEELKIEIKNAELQRFPNSLKQLSAEQTAVVLKMLDKFEEDDDVLNVFHNMELNNQILEQISKQ